MKTRIIVLLSILILSSIAVATFACGGHEDNAPAYYVVRVETGVGSRCGHLFHYGTFKTYDDADRWMKARYSHPAVDTETSVHPVWLVTEPEKQ